MGDNLLMKLLRRPEVNHNPPGPSNAPPPPVGSDPMLLYQETLQASSTSESLAKSLVAAAEKGHPPTSASFYKGIPKGRSIAGQQHVVYDIANRQAGEEQPELEVQDIAHYNVENAQEHRQQIAVNQQFICYVLHNGSVRVLHKGSTARAQAKGHLVPTITDLRFFNYSSNYLASASRDGQANVWLLEGGSEGISTDQIAAFKFSGSDPDVEHDLHISWWPVQPDVMAVACANHIFICNLVELKESGVTAHTVDPTDVPAGVVTFPPSPSVISSLAFSPDGARLAYGTTAGRVQLLEYPPGAESGPDFDAHPNEGVGSIAWLGGNARSLLLTGNRRNQELKLWDVSEGAKLLQTVTFTCEQGPLGFFNRLDVDQASGLLVLSNALRPAWFTLHLAPAGRPASFDYMAEFRQGLPVISLQVVDPPGEEGEDLPLHLYCVQTRAVQLYTLYPELCCPPPELPPAGQPLPAPAASAAAPTPDVSSPAPAPSPAPAQPGPSPFQAAEDASMGEGPSAQGTPARAAEPAPPSPAPIRLPHPSVGSSEGLVLNRKPPSPLSQVHSSLDSTSLQPRLLTPTQLLNSAKLAASRTNSEASAASAEAASRAIPVGPSVMASPRPESVPLPDGKLTPQGSREGPALSAPAPAPAPPPPDAPAPPAPSEGVTATAEAGAEAGAFAGIVPGSQPPLKVLKRSRPPSPSPAFPTPPGPAAPAPQPRPDAFVGPGVGDGQGAAIADLQQKMTDMQKKLSHTITQSGKDCQRTFREEMKREVSRLETLSKQEVDALRRLVQEERAAQSADEHSRLKELIRNLSISVNRDLVDKIQDIVRREVVAEGASQCKALATAVDASHARSAANIESRMQAAAEGALPAALAQPLQTEFTRSFQHLLIPAFESACQSMFQQVQQAFSAGLAEQLQAAKGATAAVAASLDDALTRATAALERNEALGAKLAAALSQVEQRQEHAMNGEAAPLADVVEDPFLELGKLIREGQYGRAIDYALNLENMEAVNWVCGQLDPDQVLASEPPALSQSSVLALLQQLSADWSQAVDMKLQWIRAAAAVVNPYDPVLRQHVYPILMDVLGKVKGQMAAAKDAQANQCRTVMHTLNSVLHQCQGR